MGCVVLGASFDMPEDNLTFAEAQSFPFRLLSDPDHTAGRAYEAERGSDEQYPDYPRRVAYLIDPSGAIARSYEVTDVAGFAGLVIADLGELTSTA